MLIDFDNDLRDYIFALAQQRGLPGQQLIQAVIGEEIGPLAQLLGRDAGAVTADLQALQRALVVDTDWGAGCALLTSEVRATAEAALSTLITGH